MRRSERGFTLIEVAIGVAIVALLTTAGIAIAMSSRPSAVYAAATRFDALLDAARTEARAFDSGVTIAFTPGPGETAGQGFHAQLYRNRPALGALTALNVPPLDAQVAVAEASLGNQAFALTIHADGRVAGISGYTPASASSTPETPCPPSGSYHLVFSAGPAHADRHVPCRITLATNGIAAFATPQSASASPVPPNAGTTCIDSPCASATAPANAAGQCPPNYFFISATSCVDPPLQVTPSTLVFPFPGTAAQTVAVHEQYYTGPIFLGSSTCGNAIAVRGGGNGTDTSFSVSPAAAASCSFQIDDNHAGKQTISVTTYGALTVSPQSVTFPDYTKQSCVDNATGGVESPCTFGISKWGYNSPNTYTVDATACGGIASATPSGSIGANGASAATINVAPIMWNTKPCMIHVSDTTGETISVQVQVNHPPCPAGTTLLPNGQCSVNISTLLQDCYALNNKWPFNNGFGAFPNYWPTSDAAVQNMYNGAVQYGRYPGTLQQYEQSMVLINNTYDPANLLSAGNPSGKATMISGYGPSVWSYDYNDFFRFSGSAWQYAFMMASYPGMPSAYLLDRSPDGFVLLEEQANGTPGGWTTDTGHNQHYCVVDLDTPGWNGGWTGPQ